MELDILLNSHVVFAWVLLPFQHLKIKQNHVTAIFPFFATTNESGGL